MKGDLTSYFRFFRPVMKLIYVCNCNAVIGFNQVGFFLLYQGMWGLRDRAIWFAERGVFGSQRPGNFLLASVFCFNLFSQKNKSTEHLLFATAISKLSLPPPQVHHYLTCCHNFIGDDGEQADKDENWGGVCFKGKGWRFGRENKGRKKWYDE